MEGLTAWGLYRAVLEHRKGTLEYLLRNPKGPSTQYLGTWDLGNSNFSTGIGEVYDY